MKMRRVLTAFLAVAMLLSLMPVVSFGVTTNDVDTKGTTTGPYDNSELYLGKTATLEDDGTYTIRLEAFATGNPVTTQLRSGLPLDIVLVLDQSGSMFTNGYLETLRESVDEFIDVIAANGRSIGVTHRVAIVGFASDEDDGSSGNADNTDHQLAGGSDNVYTNTGVFLEDGTFKNYGDAVTSYIEFDGTPVLGGTYYIRDSNRNYQELTANTTYKQVSNPSTSRDDLFARVGSNYNYQYLPAFYATNAYYPVTSLDGENTYYVEIDGVKTAITATGTTAYNYTRTSTISNSNGQVYYIDTDTSASGENWITVTYNGSTWRGSDGNTYTRSGTTGNRYFTRNNTTYYAHNRSETTKYEWHLSDGTVIEPSDYTVYDRLSGWVYLQDGAYHSYTGNLYEVDEVTWRYSNTTYDPDTAQFFVQATTGGLTEEDYRDALMPVTDGEAGAGRVTAALDIAVSKIASSGGTRPSLGMDMAKNILDNRTSLGDDDKRQTVVVVFTDGSPGYLAFEEDEANAAMAISAELKSEEGHNATVYAIGLYPEKSDNNVVSVFMHGLSSDVPTAKSVDDVAESQYVQETVYLRNLGLTDTYTVVEEYYHRTGYNGNYTYYPVQARLNGNTVQVRYVNGKDASNVTVTNATGSESRVTLYKRTFADYATNGKHYLYSSDVEALYDIFPEIVTDSTTTTLDQKWLTEETLLRDILETGFVFTNGTTVTMSSLPGKWDDGMITWGDTETLIDSVTVTDASAEKTTSSGGKLSVHNQGGYQFIEATGYDFNANYFSQGGHEDGAKLIVTITRVEATDLVTWNQTELTNNPYSGVWSPLLDDGTRAQIGVFPQPNTFFTDAVAVLDYAKTTADLAEELRQSGIKHLDADGMHYFTSPVLEQRDTYGDISAAGGKLTYTPNTMKWDGYDAFYVFGNTNDAEVIRHSANKVNQNLWSRVTVIPANSVYYEDTFIEKGTDGQKPDWSNVTVGIEYTGEWSTVAPGTNTEAPEHSEDTTADGAQGGVHGWEDSLADDTGYSDGTVAVGGANATATFTFAGTGVDIYSRTNLETGLIMASIYEGEKAEGLALRTLLIDNFAHSGDYYMIPTLSIHQKVYRVNNVTQLDEDGNILYVDLPYGTYTVKLTVIATTNDADMDGVDSTRSTYYLDGIRVYNPVAPDKLDSTVKEAYGDDELNASFVEVRDILLDANSFEAGRSGTVFIDQMINKDEEGIVTGEGDVPGSTSEIGVYKDIGPENEVYLGAFQSIAFAPGDGDKYYVGLKSPTGNPVDVMIYRDGESELISISHTTDMFYEVTPEDGIVSIMNMSFSGELLAVTKIKATSPDPEIANFAMFRSVSREEVLAAADAAYASLAEPEVPEIPDIEVEIENPEIQEPETQPNLADLIRGLVGRIFDNLWDWFL